jgi:translocator protein
LKFKCSNTQQMGIKCVLYKLFNEKFLLRMSRVVTIAVNWIMLTLTLTVNGLANALPINGYDTGQISDMYPNLFVPAGFTFGIWGFIYLLLALHATYSTYILSHKNRSDNAIGSLVKRINPLFWLTCIFNTGWILAWHHLFIGLSVAIMIALFLTLLQIFRIITIADREIALGYMEHISLETPFIIYFSWIAVALIANITALLVSQGFTPANQNTWCCIMIIVAAMIGVVFSLYFRRPAYTAVIIWALIGIYSKQAVRSELIATTTISSIVACFTAAVIGFWFKRKLLFRPSVQAH